LFSFCGMQAQRGGGYVCFVQGGEYRVRIGAGDFRLRLAEKGSAGMEAV